MAELTDQARRAVLAAALRAQLGEDSDCWLLDVTATSCAYECWDDGGYTTWQVPYTLGDDLTVAFGQPTKVVANTEYLPVQEATARYGGGRVTESKGTAADGGRIFRVTIIQPGVSKNGVSYPSHVLEAAAPLYEGAKAFDHHRTLAELESSTITGLIGSYRNVSSDAGGVHADLHLLPSATHCAEALDASLAAQAQGLPPVVGLSHDVQAVLTTVESGGRRIREATSIKQVLSADIVADPSAGGHAVRAVAGGTGAPDSEEETMTLAELLASASDEDKAALRTLLADEPTATTDKTDDETDSADDGAEQPEAIAASTFAKGSALGDLLIDRVLESAGLAGAREAISSVLPDRFSEADLTKTVAVAKRVAEGIERRGLKPSVPHIAVGQEDLDRRIERLDRTLEGNYRQGYGSWRQIARDFLGDFDVDLFGTDDFAGMLIQEAARGTRGKSNAGGGIARAREAVAAGSARQERLTEAIAVASFGEILGDSITRRMVAEYQASPFMNFEPFINYGPPLQDFRTRRVTRLGGYANLATVNEAAAYAAMTSPTDEEATFAPTKRGGTEVLSMESIANDDLGALRLIPRRMANAAANTLHDFVWNFLVGNGNVWDGVALFAAGHANTAATSALSAATLNVARKAMRQQAPYGASAQRLNLVPRHLLVPADLEDTAFRLATSAVAVTTNANSTEPNLHQGLNVIVDPYLSDTNDWFLVADPNQIETIEVAFFRGRQEPEIFVQDMDNVGSMFTNDQLTYKIRHIYGGAVIDYRGFYRGQG